MSELRIYRCESCGTNLFPARLRCPSCGATALSTVDAGPGRVEEETTLGRTATPIRLGSVHLETGPIVIARLEDDATAGASVRLDEAPDGAIHARKIERST